MKGDDRSPESNSSQGEEEVDDDDNDDEEEEEDSDEARRELVSILRSSVSCRKVRNFKNS
jgi:hypothetical protein